MRMISIKKCFLLILTVMVMSIGQCILAKDFKSIEEIDSLQQSELSQLDLELDQSRRDLNNRKKQEMEIVKNSYAVESSKTRMINEIETRYTRQEKKLESKYKKKKDNLIDYYEGLKKDILSAIPTPTPTPVPQPVKINEPQPPQAAKIFIPPQKLIDNWRIYAGRFIGTLRFKNSEGVFIAQVRFFKYNKWDDVFNLTYDGQNIAFDYENPYGVRLHFEGRLNKSAKKIKGEFLDINKKDTHSWYAYR